MKKYAFAMLVVLFALGCNETEAKEQKPAEVKTAKVSEEWTPEVMAADEAAFKCGASCALACTQACSHKAMRLYIPKGQASFTEVQGDQVMVSTSRCAKERCK